MVNWQKEHPKTPVQFLLVDFDRHLGQENLNHNIDETYLCGPEWPRHDPRMEWPNKSSILLYCVSSGDVQKADVRSILMCVFESVTGVAAWDCTTALSVTSSESHVEFRSAFIKILCIIWQRRKWKFRSTDRLRYVFLIFHDNYYLKHTHHAWSSQM